MPTPEAPRTGLIELRIVVASTRPRRLGPVIADWVRNQAPLDVFAVEVIDLAELNLPLLDEVEMPSTGIYHHEHTLRWKGLVDGADAIVLVTPEYNAGYPAALKNAIDYLYAEWAGKPIALFAYGHSGGASASAQLSVVLSRVKATLVDGVGLRYRDHLDGTVGPEATVRADAELLGATRRMYAALAAAARPN
ncbi:MAG TPA: NAD(P)H-dependent oxidoreductase [Dermatophilaceae bacterium]|jgi:NAD(P)H-dependent FMN reductase|nr:NAD(P)H-dependent oxidoreductase [Dermatophilaceae bacterium]HPZ67714.1 NAD(P)H-dependent oxidoreductase [Dermatophilaceae bacterium]HQD00545.1 NAD(P)H-dependent oxidoreductase [Dermatophilaceae bacterium]